MKNKSIILLIMIFLFMLLLNIMTPMLNEDYFAAFVWPDGVPNLGALPENARRISCLSEYLDNMQIYYLTEGGRVPGGVPGSFFSWHGKPYFNPLNALMMVLLIIEIYWLSHEGKITFDFEPAFIFWIAFSIWAFGNSMIDTCLWMSGSSNYLWMLTIVLGFLVPYVQDYYNTDSTGEKKSPKFIIFMFFFGILAGWSHETTICWIILILTYWLWICKKRNNFQLWKLSGYIGLCLGYGLLLFAPGNFSRLHLQNDSGLVLPGHELFFPKLFEQFVILIFQLFLWYFIIGFFFHYKRLNKNDQSTVAYSNYVKACVLIAFGSSVFMFLIPVSGWRPCFLSLVYLIVAAASLFRLQEKYGLTIINDQAKSFLKIVGSVYFLFTITVSLWGNYTHWKYWNDVLEKITLHQKTDPNTVLEITPPLTNKNYLFWRLGSGSHLIYIPVVSTDEKDRINRTVARYYEIKGIRVADNNGYSETNQ